MPCLALPYPGQSDSILIGLFFTEERTRRRNCLPPPPLSLPRHPLRVREHLHKNERPATSPATSAVAIAKWKARKRGKRSPVAPSSLVYHNTRRCEEMLQRGMLTETADLLIRGMLDPASPAGRAIGYRQAIDFLSQEAQLAGNKDAEAAAAAAAGGGSSCGIGEKSTDPEARFLQFCTMFAAKTRQYSGEQMKWFRSPKGRDFSWQAWGLGGPIEEGCRSARETRSSPAPVVRAGDGRDWPDVATSIAESFDISREEFEEQLDGEHQASLRSENQIRAGDMKRYVPQVSLLGDRGSLRSLVQETQELATRLRESQLQRQSGVEEGAREAAHGWHPGNR